MCLGHVLTGDNVGAEQTERLGRKTMIKFSLIC